MSDTKKKRAARTHFVVMGVAGSGKTSVGLALSRTLGTDFIDGDDLHSPSNIAKMARGEPLTDEDRALWLEDVGHVLKEHEGPLLVGCSALKRHYRDRIRAAAGREVTFLYLKGSSELIAERMARRERHFMPLSLLDSQFAALEEPQPDEDAIAVDIDASLVDIIDALAKAIRQD